MNYLKILEEANQRSGLQGEIDSVTGLKAEQYDVKAAVDNAYRDIQNYRDSWSFMQLTVRPVITAADPTYTNDDISLLKYILYESKTLEYVDYDTYLTQTWSTAGPPSKFTVVPETMQIIFNPLDASYQVSIRYIRVPHELLSQGDIPILPLQYHIMIAYKAASDVAFGLGNDERGDSNLISYDQYMNKLLRNQNPSVKIQQKVIVRM